MSTHYYNEFDPFASEWLSRLAKDGLIPDGKVDTRSICDVQAADLMGYRQCHFFAGIGGWPLAFRIAGIPEGLSAWSGSCPCQPYSEAGDQKGNADERNLWPVWFPLIRECGPEIVVGEQVASGSTVGTELEAAFVTAIQRGDTRTANRLAIKLEKYYAKREPGIDLADLDRRWIDGVRADLETTGHEFWFCVLGAHSKLSPHIRQRIWWGGHPAT